MASWKNALDRVRSGQEEGAPDLRKYDASDWSDFAVVEDVRETQVYPGSLEGANCSEANDNLRSDIFEDPRHGVSERGGVQGTFFADDGWVWKNALD